MNWSSSSTAKSTRCSVGPSAPCRPWPALRRPTTSSTRMPTQIRHAIGPVKARRRSISCAAAGGGSRWTGRCRPCPHGRWGRLRHGRCEW
eukprot:6343284-Prymnesium_polylepis.1